MKPPAVAFQTALALAAAGCTGEHHEDLPVLVDAAPPPNVGASSAAAAPAATPFSYAAAALRDPFQPKEAAPMGGTDAGAPPAPDLERPKQPLERFSIGQLRMVGTLSRGRLTFGLVQDAHERVHRVRPGDFLGTDFGAARAIDATGIDLLETISDGAGGWARRERRMALDTHDGTPTATDPTAAPAPADDAA